MLCLKRGRRSAFRHSIRHCLAVPHVHSSWLLIFMDGLQLICSAKCVQVRVRRHLHDDAALTQKKGAAGIVRGETVVHLALWGASCLVCTPAQPGRTNSGYLTIHVDELHDRNITLEATLFRSLPKAITNDEPLESNKKDHEGEKMFKKPRGSEKTE